MHILLAAVGKLKAGPDRELFDRYWDRLGASGRLAGFDFAGLLLCAAGAAAGGAGAAAGAGFSVPAAGAAAPCSCGFWPDWLILASGFVSIAEEVPPGSVVAAV